MLAIINYAGQPKKINTMETKEKKPVSITMRYCDKEKQGEHRYKNFIIDKSHWELIFNVMATATYDERQYDEIKNPHGYNLKIEEPDYVLTIQYDNNTNDILQVWTGSLKISMKGWYFADNKYYYEFSAMLAGYLNN
jgi:hypothetical protein